VAIDQDARKVAAPVVSGPPAEFPIGWFQVAWTGELPAGGVKPLKYFESDLVLFRTDSGKPAILDAHCLHNGAHLGYGGTVEGDGIRCPFHGWKWSDEGANVDVPYGGHSPVQARMACWPVREVGSFIYVWYHPDKEPPSWEPPVLEEEVSGRFYPVWPDAVDMDTVNFYPQLQVENQADAAHIQVIHKWQDVEFVSQEPLPGEPHTLRTILRGVVSTPRGPTEEGVDATSYGMGIIVGRMRGFADMATIGCFTPIDAETSHARISVFVEREPGDDGDELSSRAKAIFNAQQREILGETGDRGVFEHLAPPRRPMLRSSEQPLRDLRKWARQFYKSTLVADANGDHTDV
jgi:3-ketosteroid 9alpha-monooxygenase subunit A